ncbi:hypothetical protein [Lyngbya aestuarii]
MSFFLKINGIVKSINTTVKLSFIKVTNYPDSAETNLKIEVEGF